MDQIHQPVRQVPRKIWPKVSRSILLQLARHKDLGIAVIRRQLNIGIGLVIAQKNVEARLLLLDQVILERQRFMLVGDRDVLHVHGLAH
jgi:hypothetical protein